MVVSEHYQLAHVGVDFCVYLNMRWTSQLKFNGLNIARKGSFTNHHTILGTAVVSEHYQLAHTGVDFCVHLNMRWTS